MKNKKDKKVILRNGRNRLFDRRFMIFCVFAFTMVATLSFLMTGSMEKATAADLSQFKAGNIISDAVMRNYISMTESEIQTFLDRHVSCNRSASGGWYVDADTIYGVKYNYKANYGGTTYFYHVEDGKYVCMNNEKFNGETAAHIIYSLAHQYKINPQVILVLLEKEQGLVSDNWPNSNFQYRSATGFGCPDTAPCDSEYYGLRNQIESAVWLFDQVLSGGWTNYYVGNNWIRYSPNASCGGSWVNIENKATAALYRYTPYQPNEGALAAYTGTASCGAYGNRNFFIFFSDWFGSTQTVKLKEPSADIPADVIEIKVDEDKYLVPASNKQGAKIIVSDDTEADDRQYRIEKKGDYIVLVHVKTGLVVDLSDGDIENGVLQLYAEDGTSAQKWRLTASGESYILHSSIMDDKVVGLEGDNKDTEKIGLKYYTTGDAKQKITIIAKTEAPIEEGVYVLETTGGKAMYIKDGRTANGTGVVIYNPTYDKSQQFEFIRTTDGYYTIRNVASGKVLDVAAAGTDNGTAIQLYTSNNTCAQKWIVEKIGSGYRFLSSCSGKAIDVQAGQVSTNSQKIQIYSKNGTDAQTWNIIPLQPLSDGEYVIKSLVGEDFVMDISGGAENSSNGTNIHIYNYNGTNAQKFKVSYNDEVSAYSIVNTYASNRSIDVNAASTSTGANVQVWTSNLTCAQLWHLRPSGDGVYNLISACSDKVLDVYNGQAANRANIQIWSLNNSNAQRWTFEEVESED